MIKFGLILVAVTILLNCAYASDDDYSDEIFFLDERPFKKQKLENQPSFTQHKNSFKDCVNEPYIPNLTPQEIEEKYKKSFERDQNYDGDTEQAPCSSNGISSFNFTLPEESFISNPNRPPNPDQQTEKSPDFCIKVSRKSKPKNEKLSHRIKVKKDLKRERQEHLLSQNFTASLPIEINKANVTVEEPFTFRETKFRLGAKRLARDPVESVTRQVQDLNLTEPTQQKSNTLKSPKIGLIKVSRNVRSLKGINEQKE